MVGRRGRRCRRPASALADVRHDQRSVRGPRRPAAAGHRGQHSPRRAPRRWPPLGAFVLTGAATVPLGYAAFFILGSGETLAEAATSPLLVNTVSPDRLGEANAHLGLTFTAGKQLIGPLLGALSFRVGRAVPSLIQVVGLCCRRGTDSRAEVPDSRARVVDSAVAGSPATRRCAPWRSASW